MQTAPVQRAFDWTAAAARLERVARKLGGEQRPPEEVERILQARARALARPVGPPPEQDLTSVVVFPLAGERFAVDLTGVAEVARLRSLVPLPSGPPSVLGIVVLRGRIVPVVDLRRLLRPAEAASPEQGFLVVVGAGEAQVGLFADGPAEVARVPTGGLAPALARDGAEPLLRGLTRDALALVDVDALMTDPRLTAGKAG